MKNCGDLSVIRVGRKSQINPAVYGLSLDSLVKREVDKRGHLFADNLAQLRENLSHLNKALDDSEKERHKFQLLKRKEKVRCRMSCFKVLWNKIFCFSFS